MRKLVCVLCKAGRSPQKRNEDHEKDDLVDILHECHHDINGTNGKIHPNPHTSESFILVCLYSGINQSQKTDPLLSQTVEQINFTHNQYQYVDAKKVNTHRSIIRVLKHLFIISFLHSPDYSRNSTFLFGGFFESQ